MFLAGKHRATTRFWAFHSNKAKKVKSSASAQTAKKMFWVFRTKEPGKEFDKHRVAAFVQTTNVMTELMKRGQGRTGPDKT